jgi:ribosomal-protein-alanine N-acetyltransferase
MAIVPLRREDIPAVLELEKNILSAWSREHLEDELRQPSGFQFVIRSGAPESIEAVLCGRIMGDEAEILKLSVAENARQKGKGYLLLDYALDYCGTKGVKNCFLELRASNIPARRLYEKRGFLQVGSRKSYYDQPREDAILMRLGL